MSLYRTKTTLGRAVRALLPAGSHIVEFSATEVIWGNGGMESGTKGITEWELPKAPAVERQDSRPVAEAQPQETPTVIVNEKPLAKPERRGRKGTRL